MSAAQTAAVPVVISDTAHMARCKPRPTGSDAVNSENIVKSIIYPPSFVIISNPFIMASSTHWTSGICAASDKTAVLLAVVL